MAIEPAVAELKKIADMETMEVVHDEMESWLWSKQGGGTLTSEQVTHHTASLVEHAVVNESKVAAYVQAVCGVALNTFEHESMKATFIKNIERAILTSSSTTLMHEITIPKECGGIRVLETYLMGTKELPGGEYEFVIAHFADVSELSKTFQWLVSAHDETKIKIWMNFKLYKKIKTQCPELVR